MSLDNYAARKTKRLKEEETRMRERELADIAKVLSLPEGRRFIWRILSEGKIFNTPFTGDDARTNFNCGAHDLALMPLNDMMEIRPEAFAQMRNEYVSAEKSRRLSLQLDLERIAKDEGITDTLTTS